MTHHLPPQITLVQWAGHEALRLGTRHGVAIIALHGAHLVSWVPTGQREVLWLSPISLAEPAPIRGGVPLCWPWFARQGQPDTARQHGLARVVRWRLETLHHSSDEEVFITLAPAPHGELALEFEAVTAQLEVRLDLRLGHALSQTLHTFNRGTQAFVLTQALHSYFAVGDARQVGIEGLQGLTYVDKLQASATAVQAQPFALDEACDRIYTQRGAAQVHQYSLIDPVWQRRLQIRTEGSQSAVVWNPGQARARTFADMPDDAWPQFFCIETSNAGPDVVPLAAGAQHRLCHSLALEA